MPPTVSVFIPAYNAEEYLEETIRGVLAQTFQDWELIVVNNASMDSTGEIIQRLASEFRDPRIRILANSATLPAPDNWNVGLRYAKGEFLKMICADDIPTQDSLERQVKVLQSNPSLVVASGSRTIINSKGKVLFTRSGIRKTGFYAGREMIRRCIMAGTNIIGDPVNVMWRRSAMEKVGLFDPTVVYCTDIEYWLRLLSVGDLYYDTEPTGFYRIHSGAAATGLSSVTVKDFLHTARLQQGRGSVTLSHLDETIIQLKSALQSITRQWIYKLLGN
jgi:glycosyltransferase involved in cell wall biosynthesis